MPLDGPFEVYNGDLAGGNSKITFGYFWQLLPTFGNFF